MGKYKFSRVERFAVWQTYGGACYWCRSPIKFSVMEVDHLIAESLANDAEALKKTISEFGLPETFNVNEFANWVAACGECNRQKAAMKIRNSPKFLFVLGQVSDRADRCRELAKDLLTDKEKDNLLAKLAAAIERSEFDENEFKEVGANLFAKYTPAIQVLKSCTEGLYLKGEWYIVNRHGSGLVSVAGPKGVGVTVIGDDPDPNYKCEKCGDWGPWQGIKCVGCGHSQEPWRD